MDNSDLTGIPVSHVEMRLEGPVLIQSNGPIAHSPGSVVAIAGVARCHRSELADGGDDDVTRVDVFRIARAAAIDATWVARALDGELLEVAGLGAASTGELLAEVATRMETLQNSDNGRLLARLCREAIDNLRPDVLAATGPAGGWEGGWATPSAPPSVVATTITSGQLPAPVDAVTDPAQLEGPAESPAPPPAVDPEPPRAQHAEREPAPKVSIRKSDDDDRPEATTVDSGDDDEGVIVRRVGGRDKELDAFLRAR